MPLLFHSYNICWRCSKFFISKNFLLYWIAHELKILKFIVTSNIFLYYLRSRYILDTSTRFYLLQKLFSSKYNYSICGIATLTLLTTTGHWHATRGLKSAPVVMPRSTVASKIDIFCREEVFFSNEVSMKV